MKGKRLKAEKNNKDTLANIGLIVVVTFILCIFTLAAAEEESAQQLTDEQKMEEVRGYFESEYQEEDYFRADRLLLTATGSLKPLHKAPSVASVITAEDIEKMGARTLEEILETVPGLHVSVSNKNAMQPIFSIRGIHTSLNPQVLLLMNGNPLTYTYSGGRITSLLIPVANISRVEVVRGPGSAVHGADAFAGTINIITKDGPEIDGTHTGFRVGSFDTRDAWVQHGGTHKGWDVAFNLEYLDSDGDDGRVIDTDLQTLLDGAFGTDASMAPGPLQTDYQVLNLNLSLSRDKWTTRLWYWQNTDVGNADGVTQTLPGTGNEVDAEQFLAEVVFSEGRITSDLAMDLHLSYMYEHADHFIELFPAGALLTVGTDGNLEIPPTPTSKLVLFADGVFGEPIQTDYQYNADLTLFYTRLRSQLWRFSTGVRYIKEEYEELKNFGPGVIDGSQLPPPPEITQVDGTLTDVTGTEYIFIEDQSRTLWFFSLQDEWSLAKKWELTAGIRYDHYDDFGGTTNPRLALVWETRPYLTSKLLYGEAFRPPSFTELYAQNNPSNTGNPDLDPETIRTLELGFDYFPVSKFRTILSLFAYEIKDLIELVPDPAGGGSVAQNSRDQEGYGFELEGDWQVTRTFQLKGNVAYQHSEDKDTNETIADAPELQFYLTGHWMFLPEWSLDAQYFWIDNRNRAEGDPRSDIDDYSMVNLTLRRKNIGGHWDAALLVKNLFDEDVYEPSQVFIQGDYPMEGRSIFGEVRLHF